MRMAEKKRLGEKKDFFNRKTNGKITVFSPCAVPIYLYGMSMKLVYTYYMSIYIPSTGVLLLDGNRARARIPAVEDSDLIQNDLTQ